VVGNWLNKMRALKRLTLILLVTGLVSCTKTTNQTDIPSSPNSSTIDTIVVERYFPTEKAVNVRDTIIQTLGIQITITEKTLDTFVTEEYTNDSIKHIDKYRDIERQLKILKDNQVLVDTLFKKETFKEFLDKDFLEVSNFHGYWINNVEADRIEFFGVISKPETDWTFAFHHFFNVKTKEFKIKEEVDDDM
jgi:acyl carrier protein